jgi:hypothetical protein
MKIPLRLIVFPEGDQQEIRHTLRFNQLVDINGNPLQLPLATEKMIAYRVFRINSESTRNEEITEYHLEIVRPNELAGFVR